MTYQGQYTLQSSIILSIFPVYSQCCINALFTLIFWRFLMTVQIQLLSIFIKFQQFLKKNCNCKHCIAPCKQDNSGLKHHCTPPHIKSSTAYCAWTAIPSVPETTVVLYQQTLLSKAFLTKHLDLRLV